MRLPLGPLDGERSSEAPDERLWAPLLAWPVPPPAWPPFASAQWPCDSHNAPIATTITTIETILLSDIYFGSLPVYVGYLPKAMMS
jgi:hypothetical protein